MNVSVENGKYRYVMSATGESEILRHGETWRDTTGDKAIYCFAYELDETRAKRDSLAEALELIRNLPSYREGEAAGIASCALAQLEGNQ